MMRNLSFPILLFFAATLFLSAFSEKTDHNCEKELKLLRSTNDSLVQRLADAQTHAEEQAVLAMQYQKIANTTSMEAEKQRQAAERAYEETMVEVGIAQEQALVQAERAILANDEAQKYRLLAEDYKAKLAACKDNQ